MSSSWPVVVSRDVVARDPRLTGVVRVRRGGYVALDDRSGPSHPPELMARARIAAFASGLRTEYWFSHESAALVWGCWVVRPGDLTHIVQLHRAGHRRDRSVVRHFAALPVEDRAETEGFRVTSLARTVVDCLACLPPGEGLAVADSALRLADVRPRVEELLAQARGMRGVLRARAVWPLADARSESAGESLLRWLIRDAGIAPPELQREVATWLGVFRVDFAWPDCRLVVEFDGRIKYSGAYGAGSDVLWAEKRRQDALAEAGWRVLRVTWSDLKDPAALTARLRRAGVPLA